MAQRSDQRGSFAISYRSADDKFLESSEGATSFCFVAPLKRGYRSLPEVWLPYPRYRSLIDLMESITLDAFDDGKKELQGQIRYLLGVDDEIEEAVNLVRRSESS